LQDDPVELQQGDVFLGLDLQPQIVPKQSSSLAEMRRIGVQVHFVMYDLLPILLPRRFRGGDAALHASWVSTLSRHAAGVVCISRSVANELVKWLNTNGAPRQRPLQIGWFHLGSDVDHIKSNIGLPDQAGETLVSLAARPSFLMVGTIEPRKAYTQTL